MRRDSSRPAFAATIGLVLVSLALAGCAQQGGGGSGAMFSSYDEAKNADGVVLQPNGTQSPVRLKLLKPASTDGLSEGEQDIVVLLYNSNTDQPITDADFSADPTKCDDTDAFCAWMPSMGHGTGPEESPTHVSHGEYHGMTTFSMPGRWQLELNPQLANGDVVTFDTKMTVG